MKTYTPSPMPRQRPLAPSGFTGLEDLAAATYTAHTSTLVPWDRLPEQERERWVSVVSYTLDIALDPNISNYYHPEMARIRDDAKSARKVAERRLAAAISDELETFRAEKPHNPS